MQCTHGLCSSTCIIIVKVDCGIPGVTGVIVEYRLSFNQVTAGWPAGRGPAVVCCRNDVCIFRAVMSTARLASVCLVGGSPGMRLDWSNSLYLSMLTLDNFAVSSL